MSLEDGEGYEEDGEGYEESFGGRIGWHPQTIIRTAAAPPAQGT